MAEYCDSFAFSENNQDHYDMVPNDKDSYQFWQGLRGPYFTPSVDEDGVLSWTNNGQLPNPEPVRIVGKDGRGITLTGQCETVAELPEDPDQGEAWAVGEEEPFECYAWFGEWVDMGLLFPAGQDGVSPAVTITQTSTGHKVKITDRDHPSGQEFDVNNGTPGTPGEDGVSPAVTITQTSTGHKVKITDKTHPAGQEFDVDNGTPGAPGQGVPAGGAAGQFLRKTSAADYDAEWYSPAAGDVSYDSSLTYASGTVGKELGDQRNTLNQLDTEVDTVENGIAVIVVGNKTTNSNGAASGEFILVKNSTITDIVDGVYTASKTIPANTAIDKTYFNLDANGKSTVNKGALNLLNTKTISKATYHSIQTPQIAPGNTATVAFSYPSGVNANNLISWSVIGCIPDSANTAYALVTYFDGTNFTVVAQGSSVQSYRIRLAFFYHD